MSSLFISHSSQDNEAAEDLKARLEEQGHRSLFLDLDPEKGIQAGVSWEQTLYTKLRACRAVVALCSHNYLASHWCFAELALARMEGKAIFALQIDPWKARGRDKTTLPSILSEGQYTDLRKDPEQGYERLWHAFKVHGIVPAEQREWGPQDPPYPGLRAFEEEDAAIFFGREKEVQEGIELLTRVRRQGHPRLAMVLGASGSGKSSLARAGIVPRLRREPRQWLVVDAFRPGPQPALMLAYALSRKFEEIGHPVSEEEILDRLDSAVADSPSPGTIPDAGRESAAERLLKALETFGSELAEEDTLAFDSVERLKVTLRKRQGTAPELERRLEGSAEANPLAELASRLRRGSEATVVLVIDQFEELLGHQDQDGEPPHPANRFLRLLREAIDTEGSPLLVLGTMRSDFLEAFQKSPALLGVGFKKLSLGPMSREGMRQVVEEPATLGHLELEKGLANLLLDETGTSDALPLLAFTLRVMWDRYTNEKNRLLAIRDYEELGGLKGAMAQVADETLEAALQKGEETDLRRAFTSLARPAAEGAGWTRQPVRWDSLGNVQPMMQEFVDRRLLVRREDGTVEVAHEALFRSWETLRGWLSEDSEALHLRREIGIGAEKWQQAREEEKELYLWRKGRLQRAIELRDEGRLSFCAEELEFLEVSAEAENRERLRKKRRLQALLAAASLAAAVMTVLAILAWIGQRRAQIQAAKALTIQARTAGYPLDQSLLIAVETSRTLERLRATDDLYEARTTLLGHLLAYPQLERFLYGHEDQLWTIAMSPKGELMASGGTDGRLLLWREGRTEWNLDPCKERPLAPGDRAEPCGDILKEAVFSPLGDWLASSSDSGKILVWNTSTGELETELASEGPVVEGLAVTPDGQVVAADIDGNVRLWRNHADPTALVLGALPPEPSGKATPLYKAAVISGGQVAAVGGDWAVHLWDLPPRGSIGGPGSILCKGDQNIAGFAASTSGMLAAGFADGTFRLWTSDELQRETWVGAESPQRCTAGAIGGHTGIVWGLGFSPDGRILATAGGEGTVKLWATDTADGTPLAELGGHSRGAWAVQVAADGTVVTGAGDGMVRLWSGLQSRPRFRSFKSAQSPEDWNRVALGENGIAAVGDMGGNVHLISLPELRSGLSFKPRGAQNTTKTMGVAISPDRRFFAAAASSVVYVWNLEDLEKATSGALPRPLFENHAHKGWIWGLAFGPEGRQLASFDHLGDVYLSRVPSGDSRRLLGPGTSVETIVFDPSPANPILALGRAAGEVEIRTLDTGELQSDFLPHAKRVAALAFSPDGKWLASASADNTVRVRGTGERQAALAPLEGHEAQLSAVAFSLDGRQVASGDVDGVIRIWDARSGSAQFALLGHDSEVKLLAFQPGGWLISGAKDQTLRQWDIGILESLDKAYEKACAVANRNLSAGEWAKFFGNESYRKTCPTVDRPPR